MPVAADVLLSMVTRLRTADSVSNELEEIRSRNQRARARREGRTRMVAGLHGDRPALVTDTWAGYRRVRKRISGKTIGRIVGDVQGRWSAAEVAAAVRRHPDLPFIPAGSDVWDALERSGDAWDWGLTTVERLGATVIDVLKRALWLAPMESRDREAHDLRERIRNARRDVHGILGELRTQRTMISAFWRDSVPLLSEPPASARTTDRRARLDDWFEKALARWRAMQPPPNRQLHDIAQRLAARLAESASDLDAVCRKPSTRLDPEGTEVLRLYRLVEYLFPRKEAMPQAGRDATPDGVLRRMLQLDVVQLAFAGADDDVEQEVELVEITAAAPGPDGRPAKASTKLTGVQLSHFGAFYRRSWRVNDWLWGRIDGVARLVETLLSPERLRQLDCDPASAFAAVERLAIGADETDRAYLAQQWALCADACKAELASLGAPEPPSTLPMCARAVARRLQTQVLRDELPRLADAIDAEGVDETPVPVQSRQWLRAFRQDVPVSRPASAASTITKPPPIGADILWKHFGRIDAIGEARVEQDVGSDLFARTASTGAAVLVSVLSATPDVGRFKPVRSILYGFRGYALGLWSLVDLATGRARIGSQAVSLAMMLGTTLLALSLLVPGLPGAVAVVGLLTMLAGLTAALLLQKHSLVLYRRARTAVRWVSRVALAVAVLMIVLPRVDANVAGFVLKLAAPFRAVAGWITRSGVGVPLVAIAVVAGLSFIGRVDSPPSGTGRPAPPRRWRSGSASA